MEQIAVVADMLIEVRNEQKYQGSAGGGFFQIKPPGSRGERTWPGKDFGLPEDHLLHITRPEDRIETKVQHGELTVWPEKTKEAYVKAYNEENRSPGSWGTENR